MGSFKRRTTLGGKEKEWEEARTFILEDTMPPTASRV